MVYKALLKPIFFRLDPEQAHHLTLRLFKFVLAIPMVKLFFQRALQYQHPKLKRQCFGLTFPNPVGLAAGFDKDGQHYQAMSHLGFGFLELGTVTPKPQGGNPKPRLFRLPKDEALINRMGFNNEGVDALVERLKKGKPEGVIIGGNIGKNKTTPNEKAMNDYAICFEKLFPYVDYFVVNVSSPNTPNLRALQEKEPLTHLLQYLQDKNQQKDVPKPILLKIAPDLTNEQLDDIIEIVDTTRMAGIIATNTTISRANLNTSNQRIEEMGAGGLSGQPVKQRSTEVIRYLKERSNHQLTIIGVGGIAHPEDAIQKLKAGASLVQIYSGLVYEGPTIVKNINKAIVNMA